MHIKTLLLLVLCIAFFQKADANIPHSNGGRAWRVYGPDKSGVYGGAQGIGGIEAFVDETSGSVTGQVMCSLQGERG